MTAARIPLDKLKGQQTTLGWQRDQYRELDSKVKALRTASTNLLTGFSSISARKATSSNTSAVVVTAANGATVTSHSVEVTSLATATSALSTAALSSGVLSAAKAETAGSVALDTTKTLASLGISEGSLTVNGQSFTVSATEKLDDLIADVSTNTSANVLMTYDATAGKFSITSRTKGADSQVTLSQTGTNVLDTLGLAAGTTNGTGTISTTKALASMGGTAVVAGDNGQVAFRVNGVAFSFDPTVDSLRSVINAINASKAGVTANYDAASDRFSIVSKTTGDNTLDLRSIKGNFLDAMKLTGTDAVTAGTAAVFQLDGQTVSSQTNSYVTGGTTINLVAKTTGAVSVSTTADPDTAVAAVKTFITAYNDAIGLLGSRLAEKHDNDYPPLTDTQRTSMKDAEITTWETKAKQGLIRGDTTLQTALVKLNGLTQSIVPGLDSSMNTLAKIGITDGAATGDYDPATTGKLTIDESALRTALSNDPDGVANVFTHGSTGSADPEDLGIARRVQSLMGTLDSYLYAEAGTEGTTGAGSTLGNKMDTLATSIKTMTDKLNDKEDTYYHQFSVMEDYMSKMTTMSSYFSSLTTSSSSS